MVRKQATQALATIAFPLAFQECQSVRIPRSQVIGIVLLKLSNLHSRKELWLMAEERDVVGKGTGTEWKGGCEFYLNIRLHPAGSPTTMSLFSLIHCMKQPISSSGVSTRQTSLNLGLEGI